MHFSAEVYEGDDYTQITTVRNMFFPIIFFVVCAIISIAPHLSWTCEFIPPSPRAWRYAVTVLGTCCVAAALIGALLFRRVRGG